MGNSVKWPKTLLFLGYTSVLLMLAITMNTFYWSDDYAFMVHTNKKGILENCIYGYLTWDGRFLALAAFVQCFLLKYIQIQGVTFFWALTFVGSGFFLVKILLLELELTIAKNLQLLLGLLLTTVFWLGSYKHISETVYWGTGGAYSFDLLLGAIWIVWFLKIDKHSLTLKHKFLFFIFSFIVGATTQNLTFGILALLFVTIFIHWLTNKKGTIGFYSLLFIAVFLGLLFITLAPGNLLRLHKTGVQTEETTIFLLIKSYLQVLLAYLKISLVLIGLSIMSGFGTYFLIHPNHKLKWKFSYSIPKTKFQIAVFLKDFKWLIVSLSTVLPFMIAPGMAFPRTSLFFMYFLLLFIVYFIIITLRKLQSRPENLPSKSNNLLNPLPVFGFIFLLSISFAVYNFDKGVHLKNLMTQRENLLKASAGKIVTIQLINPKDISTCYQFSDLSLVENKMVVWRRLRLEEYYNVKQILVKE
jgi:hypothetical protein